MDTPLHSINENDKHRQRSIFGLLNRIYSDSRLTNRLKHYYACRVLALGYNASAASILLYDGGKERLVSAATYLHRNLIQLSRKENVPADIEYKFHILKYLGFYHYLFSSFILDGIPDTVSDEKAYELAINFRKKEYLSYDLPKEVDIIYENGTKKQLNSDLKQDAILFVQFCIANSRKYATDENGLLCEEPNPKYYYQLNKLLVDSEEYEIGADVESFSGRLFHKIALSESIQDDDSLIVGTQDDFDSPKKPFSFFNNLHRLNFEFRNKQYYIGIPLITNGRCIGILRLFYPIYGTKSTLHKKILYAGTDDASDFIKQHLESYDRSPLLFAVEILGNLLERAFPQSFAERIPRDFDFMRIPKTDELYKPFDEWCTRVQQAINCHGCTLRLSDSSLISPRRMGSSESIAEYIESIRQAGNPQFIIDNGRFHESLVSLFPNVGSDVKKMILGDAQFYNQESGTAKRKRRSKKIVGVLIDFGKDGIYEEAKVLRYYYVIDNKDIVRSSEKPLVINNRTMSLQLFDAKRPENSLISREYHRHFTGNIAHEPAKMKHINHACRYLLIIDIPSLEVAGVATFSNSAHRKFTLADVRYAYLEVSRLSASINHMNGASVYLAIKNSLHTLNEVRSELADVNERFKEDKLTESDKAHFDISVKRVQRKLNYLQDYATYVQQIQSTHEDPYNIVEYLFEKVMSEYGVEARFKGFCIDFKDECQKVIYTSLNQKSLWFSIQGIVENAIERTPYASILSDPDDPRFVEGFKPLTSGVIGNIRINVKHIPQFLVIDITNYGSSLVNSDLNDNGWSIPLDEEGLRRGFGLHIVRAYLASINSELVRPESQKNNVTFTVKIRY